jgi:hypothetical protein
MAQVDEELKLSMGLQRSAKKHKCRDNNSAVRNSPVPVDIIMLPNFRLNPEFGREHDPI